MQPLPTDDFAGELPSGAPAHPVASFFHVFFKVGWGHGLGRGCGTHPPASCAGRRQGNKSASGCLESAQPSPHPLPLLASTPQAAALVVYLFSGWFIGNFVLTFVILILLLAFDFWTVKVRHLVL